MTKKKPETVEEYKSRLGRIGGRASAAKLTQEQRQERGRKAIAARWAQRDAERKAKLSSPAE